MLLDHHLATTDSLFTIKTAVEALGHKISDNNFGEENEDINRALTWQPECLLRGKWYTAFGMESPSVTPEMQQMHWNITLCCMNAPETLWIVDFLN